MNLRPQRSDDTEVNITPLIDVVFLLLIFFMVSTTFDRESEIKITLPLNSRLLTVREAIRDSMQDLDDPPVIIHADAEANHQSVIKVMDAARQLGLVKITFATQILEE